MLQYKLHNNGWTAYVDIDLKTCSQEDINEIAKLIATNIVVVFKKQFLNLDEELRLVHMFKTPARQYEKDHYRFFQYAVDSDAYICRVTARLKDGKPGMGGWKDVHDWHVDEPTTPSRHDLIYMHGVEGMRGSRTSWTNGLLAYKDLTNDLKEIISDLHCFYGNAYCPHDPDFDKIYYNTDWASPIVRKNINGHLGMYYIPFQMQKFIELPQDESDQLNKILTDHILQDKYVYHHDWEDGDIIIADQWNGLHKRWPFDKMDIRLLHRASMSYPEQNYN